MPPPSKEIKEGGRNPGVLVNNADWLFQGPRALCEGRNKKDKKKKNIESEKQVSNTESLPPPSKETNKKKKMGGEILKIYGGGRNLKNIWSGVLKAPEHL